MIAPLKLEKSTLPSVCSDVKDKNENKKKQKQKENLEYI